jgi:hypothetical protein
MPTTVEYLNDLVNRRDELATGLQNNGIEVEENETFSTLVPKAIAEIEGGGAYKDLWNNVTNNGVRGDYLFYKSTVDSDLLSKTDLSHVTSAKSMFAGATILDNLNLTFHDATDCAYIFSAAVAQNSEVNVTAVSAMTANHMFSNAKVKRIIVNIPAATNIRLACAGGYCGGFTEYIEIHAPAATDASALMKDFNAFFDWGAICDVILDVPNAKNLFEAFSNCKTVRSINFEKSTDKVTDWRNCFGTKALKSLTGDLQFITGVASNTFNDVSNLVNFTPTVIACNFPITSAKKLSLESAKNIINALVDYSGTDNEFVYTVSLSEETQALLEADGATAPNDKTWLEYAADKGWNV